MKFLCIGDIHIKTNNIPNINILIKRLDIFLSTQKNLSFVVLMGDVLDHHEKLYTVCLNKLHELIKTITKHYDCYLLVGNHDFISNNITGENKHPFTFTKYMDKVKVIDKMTIVTIDNKKIIMCPFVPDNTFINPVKEYKENLNTRFPNHWKTADCILAHQLFKGAKMGAIISEDGDEWKAEYPFVISGHIHDKQWLNNDNVYYTGSSMQHAYGESHDKTIALVDLNEKGDSQKESKDNKSKITEIDLKLPKKKIIYVSDIKKIKDIKFDDETEYKISITTDIETYNTFKKTDAYSELKKRAKINYVYKKDKNIKFEKYTKHQNKTFTQILEEDLIKSENKEILEIYNKLKNLPE